jgi:hypothetical protein
MRLIAHRGNVEGPRPKDENHPEYLLNAIEEGFDIEVDVWWWNDQFYLGHDQPQWKLSSNDILTSERSWCHAKNSQALEMLLRIGSHCFWHQTDDYTLTSKNYIWTYPEKQLISVDMSVCVTNEKLLSRQQFSLLKSSCIAVCSDYVKFFRNYEVQ